MKDFWNQRYATHDTVYGKAPNLYFKSIIDALVPASLLMPVQGEGQIHKGKANLVRYFAKKYSHLNNYLKKHKQCDNYHCVSN